MPSAKKRRMRTTQAEFWRLFGRRRWVLDFDAVRILGKPYICPVVCIANDKGVPGYSAKEWEKAARAIGLKRRFASCVAEASDSRLTHLWCGAQAAKSGQGANKPRHFIRSMAYRRRLLKFAHLTGVLKQEERDLCYARRGG